MYSKLKVLFIFLLASSTLARVNLITTTTDIAWVANQLGGEHVNVKSLLNGPEDPHYVEALPSFIHKTASADIFCVIGLELESAWSTKVLKRSGNRKVQPGSKGYCDASKNVEVLGKLETALDRSHGDVHSAGNPHYHLAPSYLVMASKEILRALVDNDIKNKDIYESNFNSLSRNLINLKQENLLKLSQIKNLKFMEYHKEFTYFLSDYKLNNTGSVEDISGVPPSAARIVNVINMIKENKISAILATQNAPKKILGKLVEATGVKVIYSPLSLEDYQSKDAYKNLQNNLINQLVELK
ncbi:metal ABC transporter substrate-binding protein [Halobacteriovorax sp.]|uniref:metal ABC transporter substrate-binding protein n=1 Tax=Halobacteriovorax sp. TaxID=2020862 RepID=UPI00356397B2